MSRIEAMYNQRIREIGDIGEHLPTLKRYALDCQHVTECGVRGACSAYAFAEGLKGRPGTKLVQYDIEYLPQMGQFVNEARSEDIDVTLRLESDIKCNREQTDLLFIDTWHVYGHLKRELDYWNTYVNKYIIMHDTTVDEWEGESVRCNMNYTAQSAETGIPIPEILRGLWPAIEEFLAAHPEWYLHERYTNNNGLTVLKRR